MDIPADALEDGKRALFARLNRLSETFRQGDGPAVTHGNPEPGPPKSGERIGTMSAWMAFAKKHSNQVLP